MQSATTQERSQSEPHAIPSVIQCVLYLSQEEVDTLEKGDKTGDG